MLPPGGIDSIARKPVSPVVIRPVLLIVRVRRSSLALWLALAAMLGHGLLPQGFMLGREAGPSDRYGPMLCGGGMAHAADGGVPQHDGSSADQRCAFAVAAMAAVPPPTLTLRATPPAPAPSSAPRQPAPPLDALRHRPPATGPPTLL